MKDTLKNNKLKLWYTKPAKEWIEALPLGNGRLGCMVFGDAQKERIQFNEDTLWTGVPIEGDAGSLEDLEEARKLIFKGEYIKAQDLMNKKLLGPWNQSYAPMGDLNIDFNNISEFKEYRRELDLESASVNVEYESNDVKFTRTTFISKPDNIIVVKFAASEKGKITFEASLNSLLRFSTSSIDGSTIQLSGKAPIYALPSYEQGEDPVVYDEEGKKGMNFKVVLAAESNGGEITSSDGVLKVKNADSVILKIIAHTSFNGFKCEAGTNGRDVELLCKNTLENIKDKSYEELYNNHLKEYRKLFSRVEFELGEDANYNIPTNERLEKVKEGIEDLSLIPLYFQYGRYLLIASSREGSQPANLQGIWNQDLRPAWSSNYTTNINVEMNYWPAEVCNLSECHEPLFKMIKEESETGKETAQKRYGCRGWTANHNIDLWRQAAPAGGSTEWAYWPMAAAWLCSHLWEHYEFTRDKEFLKEMYPVMKEAALFLLDWLIEDKDGYLVTCPSISPENNFVTADGEKCSPSMASTMDMALIRNLFTNCIKSIDLLGGDLEFRNVLKNAKDKLYPYKIGKHGQLQEWFKDFDEYEIGHRHLSHLFGLYPGNEITDDSNNELYEACRVSLERRLKYGGGHTGWSCAWVINLFSRLKDSESAYKYLKVLFKQLTFSNLFNVCPPFQIDGNFGGTAAIAEMLIQSHKGYIELLPAIPVEWSYGNVTGLRVRGGFEVSVVWEKNKIKSVKIKSISGEICRIKNKYKLQLENNAGRENDDYILEFNTKPNEEYVLKAYE